jgi:two-component system, NarL family, sensor histidine kinase DesK
MPGSQTIEDEMVTLLVPGSPVAAGRGQRPYGLSMAIGPRAGTADDLLRLASAGAITFSVAIALVILLDYATVPSLSHHLTEAAAATAVYLPLHVRHVQYGLRGERPRGLALTLGAMTAAIVGVTPLLGANWFNAFSALVASLLITMPPRFAFPATASILTAVGIWASQLHNELGVGLYGAGQAVYFPVGILNRAAPAFILVWLVGALRRVQAARLALANAALVAERDRIDSELRRTVRAELEQVVFKGTHAEDAWRRGSPEVGEELQSLVEGSRRALADARRMLHHYRQASPAAELDRAALLLRAAGIDVTIELPDYEVPLGFDDSLRSSLRTTVSRLLAEGASGPVVFKLGCRGGQVKLETVRPSESEPAA